MLRTDDFKDSIEVGLCLIVLAQSYGEILTVI